MLSAPTPLETVAMTRATKGARPIGTASQADHLHDASCDTPPSNRTTGRVAHDEPPPGHLGERPCRAGRHRAPPARAGARSYDRALDTEPAATASPAYEKLSRDIDQDRQQEQDAGQRDDRARAQSGGGLCELVDDGRAECCPGREERMGDRRAVADDQRHGDALTERPPDRPG